MRKYWISKLTIVALGCMLGGCASVNPMPSSATVESAVATDNSQFHEAQAIPSHLLRAEHRLLNALTANPDDIEALTNLGVVYRHAERFAAAEKVLAHAERVSGGAAVVLNEIAITQRTSGAFASARDTYLKILHTTPDFHEAHFNLGILYDLYLGDAQLAHKHYVTYLEAVPEADAQVEKWLADLRRRFGIDPETSVVNVSE